MIELANRAAVLAATGQHGYAPLRRGDERGDRGRHHSGGRRRRVVGPQLVWPGRLCPRRGVGPALARRRGGLGAAVTSALAMQLTSRYDLVALGVEADNEIALRLYAWLGFTGTHHNTALIR